MDFSTLRITLRRFLYQFVSTFVISIINVNKSEWRHPLLSRRREREWRQKKQNREDGDADAFK